MAQRLADHNDIDAIQDGVRCIRMAEVMDPYIRKFCPLTYTAPGTLQVGRMLARYEARDDVVVIARLSGEPFEDLPGRRGQGDFPSPGFGVGKGQILVCDVGLLGGLDFPKSAASAYVR